eukprot:1529886-Pyramimonas_sp.AAC.1
MDKKPMNFPVSPTRNTLSLSSLAPWLALGSFPSRLPFVSPRLNLNLMCKLRPRKGLKTPGVPPDLIELVSSERVQIWGVQIGGLT